MPSKVLLFSANRYATPDAVFPLGLSHLSSALRRAGHQCLLLDRLRDMDRFESVVEDYKPDYVGISLRNIDDVLIGVRETFFDELASLRQAIRRKVSAPVILGGSGYSIFPKQLLQLSGADFGVAGDGEAALTALIDALENGRPFRDIPGLVYRENGVVTANKTGFSPWEGALEDEDRPEDLLRFYQDRGGVLNIQTQRGCGFRCCYCTYPLIEGCRHRRRPPERIADDFQSLERRGAKYVFIVDSVFNSSPTHVRETCEAVLRRGVKLAWGCFLRPQGLTPELTRLMARAGLAHVEFGSDSLCDRTLAEAGKGFVFEEILASSELLRREKINFCHFLICGGPGETLETLEVGFQNSLRIKDAVYMAVIGMRLYPGTPLCERALREGMITSETDLLEPFYYLAQGLTQETILQRLQDFARRSPSWIAGDPQPGYKPLIDRLRRRGIIGPLWSYVSMAQRLWPAGTASSNTL